MKIASILFVVFFLFTGCKEEKYGNVQQQIRYTTIVPAQKGTLAGKANEQYYTQFGNYITSITPTKLIAEVEIIRFNSDNESGSFMTIMRPDPSDPSRFADFSGNKTVSVTPTLNGTNIILNSDGKGGFFKNNVTFQVLWITLRAIKQEVQLPIQYADKVIKQFSNCDVVKAGNIVTFDLIPVLNVLEEFKPRINNVLNLYFGRTSTTAIHYKSPSEFSALKFIGNDHNMFIWSRSYTEWTLTPPLSGQTKIITSTIGFDNTNLIQVYAGEDNIPYTSDDIIVYAPKFWERIFVHVTETSN